MRDLKGYICISTGFCVCVYVCMCVYMCVFMCVCVLMRRSVLMRASRDGVAPEKLRKRSENLIASGGFGVCVCVCVLKVLKVLIDEWILWIGDEVCW